MVYSILYLYIIRSLHSIFYINPVLQRIFLIVSIYITVITRCILYQVITHCILYQPYIPYRFYIYHGYHSVYSILSYYTVYSISALYSLSFLYISWLSLGVFYIKLLHSIFYIVALYKIITQLFWYIRSWWLYRHNTIYLIPYT